MTTKNMMIGGLAALFSSLLPPLPFPFVPLPGFPPALLTPRHPPPPPLAANPDPDATTGAEARVSHTKGTKLASKSGSGLAAKGG